MSEIQSWHYKPKPWLMVLVILFFVPCAVVIGFQAYGNDRGMIINHMIELSETEATYFLWVLAAASVAFVVMGVLGVYRGLTSKDKLIMTSQSVSFPSGLFSKKNNVIQYENIHDISMQRVSGQTFLNIIHADGKAVVSSSLLPNKKAFEEVSQKLMLRAGRVAK